MHFKSKKLNNYPNSKYNNNFINKNDIKSKIDFNNRKILSKKDINNNSSNKTKEKEKENDKHKINTKKGIKNEENNKINYKNQKNIYNYNKKQNNNIKFDNNLNKLKNDKLNKKKENKLFNSINNSQKNNDSINKFEKNLKYNNNKRFSFSNNNINNTQRHTGFDKENKNNNSKDFIKEKIIFNTSKPKKPIDKLNFNNSNSKDKTAKNNSSQNLFLSSISDSIISNKKKRSSQIIDKNAIFENNIYNKKIKNKIPVYRRFSPDDKIKNINKKRLSYLTKKKNIYNSSLSSNSPKIYNYREDIWNYFNRDSFLNTSNNKISNNILNITGHIPHSHSNNFFNSILLNSNEEKNIINHHYNNSMNYSHANLLNNLFKKNYNNDDNEEKLLYSYNKKNKNNNIKDFIKVRIPFNGTQICPILVNYSTNNIFILNYNNLNKFNDKSILYDGNIYKVINSQNGSTQLISRYFQITKSCFRYYNNIYSVLIYNEKPLVQFDIRHIESIEIININLLNKIEDKKIEFSFSINLIKDSDFYIFATNDKEFGISIVNVLNLLKRYYEDDKDILE